MTFSTTIHRVTDRVEVRVAGPAAIRDFVDLIQAMAQETSYWSDTRLLVDLRRIEGRLSPEEQVFIGEMVAHSLSHLDKVASVVKAEEITRNSERAAQELGARLRVFDSEDEALEWLGSDSAIAGLYTRDSVKPPPV
ncbi:STAS/SEC14 domain-containing protein [uncultured Ramlibacter sp.]|uniref:STAS/SEC14 domain-containing protein n=1 Tax=uncultured Ramlibacter sp. TaxID=260755 RepID=UPI002624C094|nr:STAS/SEC14 domain-containing protein [uncultured Ramlibacter sp.]